MGEDHKQTSEWWKYSVYCRGDGYMTIYFSKLSISLLKRSEFYGM